MNAARIEPTAGRKRRAFTLVEMLVVVVIIGILAGLVSAAAVMARRTARKAEIRNEISGLEQALETFKNKYGRYPPDGSSENDVQAFILQAWGGGYSGDWKTAIGWNTWQGDQAAALVFWLGGMRNGKELLGFSPHPRNPFETSTTSGRIGPFFEFKPDRLYFVDNKLYYRQPNSSDDHEPYVYFKARANRKYDDTPAPGTDCKPCYDKRAGSNVYAKNTSFQIRAPGFDGKHGSGQGFPTGGGYDEYQYDDMSNFATGTFEDELP